MSFDKIIDQKEVVDILQEELKEERINHAYLFYGKEGIGKKTLAIEFARALLCNEMKNDSCNNCRSCRRIEHRNHPDLKIIESEEKSKNLKISQIRELQREIAYKPYESEYKIYIIDGAENMTVQAANSLLKTLEDPPSYAIIILIAEEINRLLPTVISRCQNLSFSNISRKNIEDFLLDRGVSNKKVKLISGLARGSIAKALEISANDKFLNERKKIYDFLKDINDIKKVEIFSQVEEMMKLLKDEFPLFNLLSSWYRDIIIYKSGNHKQLVNFDYKNEIKKEAKRYSLNELLKIVNLINEHQNYIDRNAFKDLTLQVLFLKIRAKRLQVRV
ncbi:MAG: DNA polymerase III subunit delta' [Bacillota bacterium]